MDYEIPKYIYDRSGKERGKTTGGTRQCKLEGCSGCRIGVRWPNGEITWPCSKGLKNYRRHMKII